MWKNTLICDERGVLFSYGVDRSMCEDVLQFRGRVIDGVGACTAFVRRTVDVKSGWYRDVGS